MGQEIELKHPEFQSWEASIINQPSDSKDKQNMEIK